MSAAAASAASNEDWDAKRVEQFRLAGRQAILYYPVGVVFPRAATALSAGPKSPFVATSLTDALVTGIFPVPIVYNRPLVRQWMSANKRLVSLLMASSSATAATNKLTSEAVVRAIVRRDLMWNTSRWSGGVGADPQGMRCLVELMISDPQDHVNNTDYQRCILHGLVVLPPTVRMLFPNSLPPTSKTAVIHGRSATATATATTVPPLPLRRRRSRRAAPPPPPPSLSILQTLQLSVMGVVSDVKDAVAAQQPPQSAPPPPPPVPTVAPTPTATPVPLSVLVSPSRPLVVATPPPPPPPPPTPQPPKPQPIERKQQQQQVERKTPVPLQPPPLPPPPPPTRIVSTADVDMKHSVRPPIQLRNVSNHPRQRPLPLPVRTFAPVFNRGQPLLAPLLERDDEPMQLVASRSTSDSKSAPMPVVVAHGEMSGGAGSMIAGRTFVNPRRRPPTTATASSATATAAATAPSSYSSTGQPAPPPKPQPQPQPEHKARTFVGRRIIGRQAASSVIAKPTAFQPVWLHALRGERDLRYDPWWYRLDVSVREDDVRLAYRVVREVLERSPVNAEMFTTEHDFAPHKAIVLHFPMVETRATDPKTDLGKRTIAKWHALFVDLITSLLRHGVKPDPRPASAHEYATTPMIVAPYLYAYTAEYAIVDDQDPRFSPDATETIAQGTSRKLTLTSLKAGASGQFTVRYAGVTNAELEEDRNAWRHTRILVRRSDFQAMTAAERRLPVQPDAFPWAHLNVNEIERDARNTPDLQPQQPQQMSGEGHRHRFHDRAHPLDPSVSPAVPAMFHTRTSLVALDTEYPSIVVFPLQDNNTKAPRRIWLDYDGCERALLGCTDYLVWLLTRDTDPARKGRLRLAGYALERAVSDDTTNSSLPIVADPVYTKMVKSEWRDDVPWSLDSPDAVAATVQRLIQHRLALSADGNWAAIPISLDRIDDASVDAVAMVSLASSSEDRVVVLRPPPPPPPPPSPLPSHLTDLTLKDDDDDGDVEYDDASAVDEEQEDAAAKEEDEDEDQLWVVRFGSGNEDQNDLYWFQLLPASSEVEDDAKDDAWSIGPQTVHVAYRPTTEPPWGTTDYYVNPLAGESIAALVTAVKRRRVRSRGRGRQAATTAAAEGEGRPSVFKTRDPSRRVEAKSNEPDDEEEEEKEGEAFLTRVLAQLRRPLLGIELDELVLWMILDFIGSWGQTLQLQSDITYRLPENLSTHFCAVMADGTVIMNGRSPSAERDPYYLVRLTPERKKQHDATLVLDAPNLVVGQYSDAVVWSEEAAVKRGSGNESATQLIPYDLPAPRRPKPVVVPLVNLLASQARVRTNTGNLHAGETTVMWWYLKGTTAVLRQIDLREWSVDPSASPSPASIAIAGARAVLPMSRLSPVAGTDLGAVSSDGRVALGWNAQTNTYPALLRLPRHTDDASRLSVFPSQLPSAFSAPTRRAMATELAANVQHEAYWMRARPKDRRYGRLIERVEAGRAPRIDACGFVMGTWDLYVLLSTTTGVYLSIYPFDASSSTKQPYTQQPDQLTDVSVAFQVRRIPTTVPWHHVVVYPGLLVITWFDPVRPRVELWSHARYLLDVVQRLQVLPLPLSFNVTRDDIRVHPHLASITWTVLRSDSDTKPVVSNVDTAASTLVLATATNSSPQQPSTIQCWTLSFSRPFPNTSANHTIRMSAAAPARPATGLLLLPPPPMTEAKRKREGTSEAEQNQERDRLDRERRQARGTPYASTSASAGSGGVESIVTPTVTLTPDPSALVVYRSYFDKVASQMDADPKRWNKTAGSSMRILGPHLASLTSVYAPLFSVNEVVALIAEYMGTIMPMYRRDPLTISDRAGNRTVTTLPDGTLLVYNRYDFSDDDTGGRHLFRREWPNTGEVSATVEGQPWIAFGISEKWLLYEAVMDDTTEELDTMIMDWTTLVPMLSDGDPWRHVDWLSDITVPNAFWLTFPDGEQRVTEGDELSYDGTMILVSYTDASTLYRVVHNDECTVVRDAHNPPTGMTGVSQVCGFVIGTTRIWRSFFDATTHRHLLAIETDASDPTRLDITDVGPEVGSGKVFAVYPTFAVTGDHRGCALIPIMTSKTAESGSSFYPINMFSNSPYTQWKRDSYEVFSLQRYPHQLTFSSHRETDGAWYLQTLRFSETAFWTGPRRKRQTTDEADLERAALDRERRQARGTPSASAGSGGAETETNAIITPAVTLTPASAPTVVRSYFEQRASTMDADPARWNHTAGQTMRILGPVLAAAFSRVYPLMAIDGIVTLIVEYTGTVVPVPQHVLPRLAHDRAGCTRVIPFPDGTLLVIRHWGEFGNDDDPLVEMFRREWPLSGRASAVVLGYPQLDRPGRQWLLYDVFSKEDDATLMMMLDWTTLRPLPQDPAQMNGLDWESNILKGPPSLRVHDPPEDWLEGSMSFDGSTFMISDQSMGLPTHRVYQFQTAGSAVKCVLTRTVNNPPQGATGAAKAVKFVVGTNRLAYVFGAADTKLTNVWIEADDQNPPVRFDKIELGVHPTIQGRLGVSNVYPTFVTMHLRTPQPSNSIERYFIVAISPINRTALSTPPPLMPYRWLATQHFGLDPLNQWYSTELVAYPDRVAIVGRRERLGVVYVLFYGLSMTLLATGPKRKQRGTVASDVIDLTALEAERNPPPGRPRLAPFPAEEVERFSRRTAPDPVFAAEPPRDERSLRVIDDMAFVSETYYAIQGLDPATRTLWARREPYAKRTHVFCEMKVCESRVILTHYASVAPPEGIYRFDALIWFDKDEMSLRMVDQSRNNTVAERRLQLAHDPSSGKSLPSECVLSPTAVGSIPGFHHNSINVSDSGRFVTTLVFTTANATYRSWRLLLETRPPFRRWVFDRTLSWVLAIPGGAFNPDDAVWGTRSIEIRRSDVWSSGTGVFPVVGTDDFVFFALADSHGGHINRRIRITPPPTSAAADDALKIIAMDFRGDDRGSRLFFDTMCGTVVERPEGDVLELLPYVPLDSKEPDGHVHRIVLHPAKTAASVASASSASPGSAGVEAYEQQKKQILLPPTTTSDWRDSGLKRKEVIFGVRAWALPSGDIVVAHVRTLGMQDGFPMTYVPYDADDPRVLDLSVRALPAGAVNLASRLLWGYAITILSNRFDARPVARLDRSFEALLAASGATVSSSASSSSYAPSRQTPEEMKWSVRRDLDQTLGYQPTTTTGVPNVLQQLIGQYLAPYNELGWMGSMRFTATSVMRVNRVGGKSGAYVLAVSPSGWIYARCGTSDQGDALFAKGHIVGRRFVVVSRTQLDYDIGKPGSSSSADVVLDRVTHIDMNADRSRVTTIQFHGADPRDPTITVVDLDTRLVPGTLPPKRNYPINSCELLSGATRVCRSYDVLHSTETEVSITRVEMITLSPLSIQRLDLLSDDLGREAMQVLNDDRKSRGQPAVLSLHIGSAQVVPVVGRPDAAILLYSITYTMQGSMALQTHARSVFVRVEWSSADKQVLTRMPLQVVSLDTGVMPWIWMDNALLVSIYNDDTKSQTYGMRLATYGQPIGSEIVVGAQVFDHGLNYWSNVYAAVDASGTTVSMVQNIRAEQYDDAVTSVGIRHGMPDDLLDVFGVANPHVPFVANQIRPLPSVRSMSVERPFDHTDDLGILDGLAGMVNVEVNVLAVTGRTITGPKPQHHSDSKTAIVATAPPQPWELAVHQSSALPIELVRLLHDYIWPMWTRLAEEDPLALTLQLRPSNWRDAGVDFNTLIIDEDLQFAAIKYDQLTYAGPNAERRTPFVARVLGSPVDIREETVLLPRGDGWILAYTRLQHPTDRLDVRVVKFESSKQLTTGDYRSQEWNLSVPDPGFTMRMAWFGTSGLDLDVVAYCAASPDAVADLKQDADLDYLVAYRIHNPDLHEQLTTRDIDAARDTLPEALSPTARPAATVATATAAAVAVGAMSAESAAKIRAAVAAGTADPATVITSLEKLAYSTQPVRAIPSERWMVSTHPVTNSSITRVLFGRHGCMYTSSRTTATDTTLALVYQTYDKRDRGTVVDTLVIPRPNAQPVCMVSGSIDPIPSSSADDTAVVVVAAHVIWLVDDNGAPTGFEQRHVKTRTYHFQYRVFEAPVTNSTRIDTVQRLGQASSIRWAPSLAQADIEVDLSPDGKHVLLKTDDGSQIHRTDAFGDRPMLGSETDLQLLMQSVIVLDREEGELVVVPYGSGGQYSQRFRSSPLGRRLSLPLLKQTTPEMQWLVSYPGDRFAACTTTTASTDEKQKKKRYDTTVVEVATGEVVGRCSFDRQVRAMAFVPSPAATAAAPTRLLLGELRLEPDHKVSFQHYLVDIPSITVVSSGSAGAGAGTPSVLPVYKAWRSPLFPRSAQMIHVLLGSSATARDCLYSYVDIPPRKGGGVVIRQFGHESQPIPSPSTTVPIRRFRQVGRLDQNVLVEATIDSAGTFHLHRITLARS